MRAAGQRRRREPASRWLGAPNCCGRHPAACERRHIRGCGSGGGVPLRAAKRRRVRTGGVPCGRHGLEKLHMLLSHTVPHLTLGGLVARLVRDGLDRYDPARPRRARRTGRRGLVEGAQTVSRPARRDVEAMQRNVVRAHGTDVERPSEAERGDRSLTADASGTPRPSAAKRHTQGECGTRSPRRCGTAAVAPIRRRSPRPPSTAALRWGYRTAAGTPLREGSASPRTNSVARRPRWRRTAAVGRPRRRSGMGEPTAMAGTPVRAVSWAVRRARLDRGSTPTGAPRRGHRGQGGRRFPTSPAKRLASAAGGGAAGLAERSPALERHLAALRCVGAVPGSRSRYIPAAVRREVWRRDEGCCSYVDVRSGRRCGSRYRLEIDHIVPFALGGTAELSNLRVVCEAWDYVK